MGRHKEFWTAAAILSLLACAQSPASAETHARTHSHATGRSSQLVKPVLKPLTPEIDMSMEPDPSELFDQAVKEYSAGHLPQAEKMFEKVIELDPGNADAHFNMGAIKEWRNDWISALNHYRAALRAKPTDKEIADAVKAVEYKIRNKSAIEAQTAKVEKERALATHSKLAKEAFSTQNYPEAIVHLSYLAEAMPEDAKIQFALGQSLRAMKNFDWAAYRLKMAIFLDPDNDLYRKTLVDLDKELQDIQSQAFLDSADVALAHLSALQYRQVAETMGVKNAF